ncbi:galactokinase family protein [Corynebacterium kutscheri]|uniref:Galactokinase n=1 Tax=Corynebacterium kutscheri TaxID=35755 RepID=A0AB38VSA7_9CORY|nr:galactokinase family protein [Corynebacterium kutscheri]VEH06837.1 galactokinase [Corynebacterium kutscheri]
MALWPHIDTDISTRVRALHIDTYDHPTAIATAPATWSLIGEHTDCFGGTVLISLANLATAVAITPRHDDTIHVTMETIDPASNAPQQDKSTVTMAVVNNYHENTPEDFSPAYQLAGLVHTMMQRQMLSRETHGFNITVVSDIPRGVGLGFQTALFIAAALAMGHAIEERDSAPVRAKLADVCYLAAQHFFTCPALRAKFSAALRGQKGQLNVIDYADGSITHASHIISSATDAVALLVAPPNFNEDFSALRRRQRFIDDATKAFGAESLRLLPDAQTRVAQWLKAVHEVHGEDKVPNLIEASQWLNFFTEEEKLVTLTTQAVRSRRHKEIFNLLMSSQAGLENSYGLGSTDLMLSQLCMARGALSARSTAAGITGSVIALVEQSHADNFAADLAEDGFIVVELLHGEPAI